MTRQTAHRKILSALAVMLLMTFSVACSGMINPGYVLPNICQQLEDTPLTTLVGPDPNDPTYPKLSFEDPGIIKAMYGFGTAKLESGKRIIKVAQSVPIPKYATRATVILNGWKLN